MTVRHDSPQSGGGDDLDVPGAPPSVIAATTHSPDTAPKSSEEDRGELEMGPAAS